MSSPPQDEIAALASLYHSGQMAKAEQACRELLQTYPQSFIAFNVLGLVLQGQGKLQEGMQAYNEAIQLNPDYADAYSNLGVLLQELGKLEDALVQYKKSFELVRGKNPVDPQHRLRNQSFQLITKAKMKHDIEQFEYLAASGYESEKFQALVNVYKAVSSEINWPTNEAEVIPLTDKYRKLLMDDF